MTDKRINNEGFAGLYLAVVLIVGAFWQEAQRQDLPLLFRLIGGGLSAAALYAWLKSRLDRAARQTR